jgi:hypothetical protein
MTQWTGRLAAALGIGCRKRETDTSWKSARQQPGRDETTLRTTQVAQEQPTVWGLPAAEELSW